MEIYRNLTTNISIHALRVEGDIQNITYKAMRWISIHALRVEGDIPQHGGGDRRRYFYPRPPGGGRRAGWVVAPSPR